MTPPSEMQGGLAQRGAGDAARTRDGSLLHQRHSRAEAEALVRDLGAQTASQVTKKVNLLVMGSNPGSKVDKAKKMNIPTIGEEEFLRLLRKAPGRP